MRKLQKISDSEMEVMREVWAAGGPVTSAQLLDKFSKGKDWKPTTVFTFLSRLVEKGILKKEKQGRASLYLPAVSENEYKSFEARSFLNESYNGSIKSFVTALFDGSDISREEIDELKKWFSER